MRRVVYVPLRYSLMPFRSIAAEGVLSPCRRPERESRVPLPPPCPPSRRHTVQREFRRFFQRPRAMPSVIG